MQMIVHSTASHQSTSSKKKAFYDKRNKDFHGLKGNQSVDAPEELLTKQVSNAKWYIRKQMLKANTCFLMM